MAAHVDPIRVTRTGLVAVSDLVVKTEGHNERALATIAGLMCRRRTPREDALLSVLSGLVENYQNGRYPSVRLAPAPSPIGILRFLMRQNRLTQKDLRPLLGGKSQTEEILSG